MDNFEFNRCLKVFEDAAVKVVAAQLATRVKFLAHVSNPQKTEITASLSAKSGSNEIQLLLLFPQKTLIGLLNRMLGENLKEIHDENLDGAAEILNIIYNQGRPLLNGTKHKFAAVSPKVTLGEFLEASSDIKRRSGKLYFDTDVGQFTLVMNLLGQ